MSEKSTNTLENLLKQLGSHVLVAILAALITTTFAIGGYKEKIDHVITENAESQVVMKGLATEMINLRVEVAGLRGEMRLNRETPRK